MMHSLIFRLLALGTLLVLAACGDGHSTHRIAGTISGLSTAGLVLQNNGGHNLAVAAHATSFQFSTPVPAGGNYNVTVLTRPEELTCTVTHGSGSKVHAAVTNISIACSPVTHTIAGTIAGLTTSGLVLQNNGADNLAVAANGTAFKFATPVAAGGGYSVTVFSQPAGLICTVSNGVGIHLLADISGIQITCNATAFSVGGTIAGLTGSGLVLQNNGDDDLTVAANSNAFEFATPVASGGGYAVTVLTQPTGQACAVAQGTAIATTRVTTVTLTCADIITHTVTASGGANGVIAPSGAVVVNDGGTQGFVATPAGGYAVDQWLADGVPVQTGGSVYTFSNVSANHTLAVTFAQATLTPSVSSLALSVNCQPTSSCITMQNAQLTGTPRQIIVSNTGSVAATNVSITYPAWPAGTAASSTCGSTLAASASCTITITPGSVATSDCTTGVAPTGGTLTVSADDASDSQVNAAVLGYGCISQGGYLFSIDDTTPDTGGIGGKVAAQSDQAAAYPGGIAWSSDGGSGVNFTSILGIDEASTTGTPSPTSPAYPGGTPPFSACNGNTDGACDSANIVSYYNYTRSSGGPAPTPSSQYAAGVCTATISGYSDWYLPAICEAGFDGPDCGSAGSPTLQNMQSNLVDRSLANLTGLYWTSTEVSFAPQIGVWVQNFDTNGGNFYTAVNKVSQAGVRCARALSP